MRGPAPIRLQPADAGRYAHLRRRMLEAAPWAFSASPADDRVLARPAEVLADARNAIYAIEAGPEALVAAAGIRRGAPPKFAHRAMIWGVFVEPGRRGQGLGRAVMTALLTLVQAWSGVAFVDLTVRDNSPEALRLYESLGFETWGREPAATEHAGRRHDELHMTLRL